MSEANDAKRSKTTKSSRGTVNNSARLAALRSGNGGGQADWSAANPQWVQAVIHRVTSLGGAVTFGLSRDQGAHMLTVMLDGDKAVLWFNGDADLDLELEKVFAQLDTLSDK